MRGRLWLAAFAASAAITGSTAGQDSDGDERLPVEAYFEGWFDDLLADPDALNDVVDRATGDRALGAFLDGIDFRLKTFDRQGAASESTNLGFEYAFEKTISDKDVDFGGGILSLDVFGRGNVAFDKDVNPNDFLRTGVKLELFGLTEGRDAKGNSGYTIEEETRADALQDLILNAAHVQGSPEEIDASPEWQAFEDRFDEDYLSRLGTDVFWSVAAQASLESNQDFSSRQLTYGLEVGAVARSWDPGSRMSRFNLFDYPGAALRILTGEEDGFRPSGRSIPSVLLGIDLVDPSENEARRGIDDGTFPRLRSELAMRSRLGEIASEEVWLSSSWQYYRELGAPVAIETAELDEHSYFAASLEFGNGWSLSYSTGKLPLDRQDDRVIELGFDFDFGE